MLLPNPDAGIIQQDLLGLETFSLEALLIVELLPMLVVVGYLVGLAWQVVGLEIDFLPK